MKKQLEKKRYETPELFVDEYAADTMIASAGNMPVIPNIPSFPGQPDISGKEDDDNLYDGIT